MADELDRPEEEFELPPGSLVGPYRVVREIGSGGMGAVYLAERADEFRLQVAIKVLRRDAGSRALAARFRHERQILAALRHEGIACLHDGGSLGDGRPYFVMELVAGVPIDEWCRARGLDAAARVRLFLQVCAAVQYAHRNLIVHCDLKPANILVTAEGTPKLLDFGIAKLVHGGEQTGEMTQAGFRLMTPEYASPEQVRGLPVTTSTDVYSLGMVLYLLLAGRPAYELGGRSLTEIERTVCETEPARPSAAGGAGLAGDLDNIILKALEKDPARRYASVEALSADLMRHLNGLPVEARPQTLVYRAGKFVRRNRAMVAAGAVAVLSLVAGTAVAARQAVVAERQRAIAERRFADVRRLANTFLFEFHDKIKDLTGSTEARQYVVTRALEYLNGLEKESAGNTGLELELAEAWRRLGDVQGNPYLNNLGDAPGALASYERAVRIAEPVLAREPGNVAARRALAGACQQRADVLMLMGREAEGVASIRKAVDLLAALAGERGRDTGVLVEYASSLEGLGDAVGHPGMSNLEDREGGRSAYGRALAAWKSVLAVEPGHARAARAVAVVGMKLADLEAEDGRLAEARTQYDAALRQALGAGTGNPENQRLVNSIRRKIAYVISYTDPKAALEVYQEAIAGNERLVAADPQSSRARLDLAVVLAAAAEAEESLDGGAARASDYYRRALEQLLYLDKISPTNVRRQEYLAETRLHLGRLAPNAAAAAEHTREGLRIAGELARREEATPRHLALYAEALLRANPASLRRPEEALGFAQRASAAVEHKNPAYLDLMAEAHFQAGRAEEAVAFAEKAVALVGPGTTSRRAYGEHLERYRKARK